MILIVGVSAIVRSIPELPKLQGQKYFSASLVEHTLQCTFSVRDSKGTGNAWVSRPALPHGGTNKFGECVSGLPVACPSAARITSLPRSFCRLISFCHRHLLFLQKLSLGSDKHGGLESDFIATLGCSEVSLSAH